ncbi:hypothetical protein I3842_08G067600 [Carya illinoinensis]|uniref:ER lumen protein retaining receptor n=1 Tax=Carya illinoinensis TaxID=32201 RepID=A0A922ECU1_CARIL|nr:hypothetical protein I3842_08G067600 [Carya illinoinensis]
MKGPKRPIHAVATWVRRQPPKVKVFLALVSALAALVLLRLVVHDHDNFFVAAEAVHALGVSVLIYKLTKEKTCAGLSLKSQELTALFLAVRLYCSFVMEFDLHTVLDSATLVTTLWVIYMIRLNLKSSYMEEKDNLKIYHVVIPCSVLSFIIHPTTQHHILNRIFWAFCVYLEAVSVLPQLRVMQNTKIVEPFTAHYVFALGVARFLSCAHWLLQVWDTRGRLLTALGYGLWPPMVLLCEIVQTFILADFCYYYVQRFGPFGSITGEDKQGNSNQENIERPMRGRFSKRRIGAVDSGPPNRVPRRQVTRWHFVRAERIGLCLRWMKRRTFGGDLTATSDCQV